MPIQTKLQFNRSKRANAESSSLAGDRPQERKFLGFSFTTGPEVKRVIAPKALNRFKQRIRHATGQERQHREDDRGTGSVYAGLAQLFRLLRNAYGAAIPHALGAAAASGRSMAAVENSAPSPDGTDRTGGASAAASNTAASGRGPWYLARSKALSIGR
jgi:RNA-directed DNA polymerase